MLCNEKLMDMNPYWSIEKRIQLGMHLIMSTHTYPHPHQAIGLGNMLCNEALMDMNPYWSIEKRIQLGMHLIMRSMQMYVLEGEKQVKAGRQLAVRYHVSIIDIAVKL